MRGSNYHDFQMLLEKRFSAGMHTAVIYTFSRAEAQDFYYNEFDSRPSWRPNSLNRPHRFRLERYFRAKRAVSTSRRGWQLSWMCQYQSGPTTEWANPFFYGNIDQVADVLNHDDAHSRDVHLWFDPNAAYRGTGAVPSGFTGFDSRATSQPGAFQTRMFPSRLGSLRGQWFPRLGYILRCFKVQ